MLACGKSVFVSERGLTSTPWTEYSENTKRIQYSAVLTSDITAETVTVDGFTLSQKDTAGVVSTATCSYTASGMLLTQVVDAAGIRTIGYIKLLKNLIKLRKVLKLRQNRLLHAIIPNRDPLEQML